MSNKVSLEARHAVIFWMHWKTCLREVEESIKLSEFLSIQELSPYCVVGLYTGTEPTLASVSVYNRRLQSSVNWMNLPEFSWIVVMGEMYTELTRLKEGTVRSGNISELQSLEVCLCLNLSKVEDIKSSHDWTDHSKFIFDFVKYNSSRHDHTVSSITEIQSSKSTCNLEVNSVHHFDGGGNTVNRFNGGGGSLGLEKNFRTGQLMTL